MAELCAQYGDIAAGCQIDATIEIWVMGCADICVEQWTDSANKISPPSVGGLIRLMKV